MQKGFLRIIQKRQNTYGKWSWEHIPIMHHCSRVKLIPKIVESLLPAPQEQENKNIRNKLKREMKPADKVFLPINDIISMWHRYFLSP